MQGIEKSFNSVQVLQGINFCLEQGSVHALMGENGAGKSTLMKILAGIYKKDKGTIKIKESNVDINTPKQSQELGVAMIHQELSPIPEMTVAENIYLGREPGKGLFLDYKEMYQQTEELLKSLKIQVSPRAVMRNLKVADQQLVEIAKAISLNAEIIVMDEPTSAITDKEVSNLFEIIEDLKKHGKGIIYISHKMDEIFQIADDITVLRDGVYVNTWKAKDINQNTLIKSMVGRELTEIYPKEIVPITEDMLELQNFTKKGKFEGINFKVKKGEIYGIAGLVGAGRTELMHGLFGLDKLDTGKVILEGKEVEIKSPKDAIANRIAYVTEDRKLEGLVLEMSVGQNITLPSMKKLSKGLFVQEKEERTIIKEQREALRIKCSSERQLVKLLSGGNQQKVVLAKWLIKSPKILILDEPTRGIDVGAKAEIYKLMCEFVGKGNSIIMISSEMPEVMGMADRILVLSNGKASGELSREEFTQEHIMKMSVEHI
ncbi:sugar ABC transporter ATP-binding protein [Lachnospiraceae bacterium PAL113]|uniref:Sugar ABC transporter ATP-binding protein n=2 Tax=Aequitasia blattaphilus TaxID=2949332 RepID=A0ABT1EBR7_9FIRM|nr:sugar ABC transporter ATP-binding protein [Aequitasia blattaphilus]MCP1103283.1 sugar ABC transporter ATP-binding protein [Aequitasia blattaphilus]MCR8615923.1 sugar ABC transporter ATP-binding protein [Aequitasia blattaphilus]